MQGGWLRSAPFPLPPCSKGVPVGTFTIEQRVQWAALKAIHDRGLYREYGTWEAYARDVWGYGKRHAYLIVDAATAVANLEHDQIDHVMPKNENQVRSLTLLRKTDPDDPTKTVQDADAQREAWKEAVDTATDSKVTGATVRINVYDGDELIAIFRLGRQPEALSVVGQHAIKLCERPAFRYCPNTGDSRLTGLDYSDPDWLLTTVVGPLRGTIYRVEVIDGPQPRPISAGIP